MKFRESVGIVLIMVSLGIMFIGLADLMLTYADVDHFSQDPYVSARRTDVMITGLGLLTLISGSMLSLNTTGQRSDKMNPEHWSVRS